ncbi:MAG: glycoside hydrolase family 2 TIM barrel-domain containing protein [Chitinophagaceae bacterium]
MSGEESGTRYRIKTGLVAVVRGRVFYKGIITCNEKDNNMVKQRIRFIRQPCKLMAAASCFLLLVILQINVYAQSQTGIQSLNGTWAFKTDPNDAGEKNKWYAEDVNIIGWDSMAVPGNWDLRNEYAHYVGKAWYRTSFSIPSNLRQKFIRLLFEAVYHDSRVWLNGRLLGNNNSGFLPFEFDINNVLHFDKPNILAVSTDNTFRRGAIWNWGGIRRPVLLEATNPVRIVKQFISSEVNLQTNTAEITVEVQIKNGEATPLSLRGEVLIQGEGGVKKLLPFTTTVEAGDTIRATVRTSISKKELHLWNCDDPFLYQSKASINIGANTLHENTDRFGIRKVEVDNKNFVFTLNGQPMRVMGFNLVPDDRTTGNTLPSWRFKEDIDLMKSMGANMTRISHLPLPKEMIDYLDQKGIMIFAEIPLWGFDQLVDKNNPVPREWLKRLVTSQYNHPAIIGWSVGNEIGGVPGVMDYVKSAIEYVKTLDSTRLAVMVSHTADQGKTDPISFSDIGLINKYGSGIGLLADKIHSFHPDKLLFYSEFGYGQLEENGNADVNAKAMVDSLRFKPYLMGGSLWTFNDYRSAYPGTREYSENRPWGVVDVFRQKKNAWFSVRREYAPVRALSVDKFIGNNQASATIVIKPRLALDLPAYPLHQYTLVWKICNTNNMLTNGGMINLPVIKPGDAELQFPVTWRMPEDALLMQVSLLSPLNYSVADTVIFLQKPISPKIIHASGVRTQMNDARANTGSMRVAFEKNSTAISYKLRYMKEGILKETTPVRTNYFIIPNLKFGDTYQASVVAINSFGESLPGTPFKIEIGKDYPAPLIIYIEPADKGFFVGYPADQEDYLFQLQYTSRQGDYTAATIVQTNTRGVLFVPGLQNGQTYYFRMRRWKHNTYITPWTEEMAVTPDGGALPINPTFTGVIRQGAKAVICFEPVKKATGYKLQYKGTKSGAWNIQDINAAQINHFQLSGLVPSLSYEFRIASVNLNGASGYSQIISK